MIVHFFDGKIYNLIQLFCFWKSEKIIYKFGVFHEVFIQLLLEGDSHGRLFEAFIVMEARFASKLKL